MTTCNPNTEFATWRAMIRAPEATPQDFATRDLIKGIARFQRRPMAISLAEVDRFVKGEDPAHSLPLTPTERAEYGARIEAIVKDVCQGSLFKDIRVRARMMKDNFVEWLKHTF